MNDDRFSKQYPNDVHDCRDEISVLFVLNAPIHKPSEILLFGLLDLQLCLLF